MDAAEIARREAINQLYDNITDDHDAFPAKMPEMPSLQRNTKKSAEKASETPSIAENTKTDNKTKSKKRSLDTMVCNVLFFSSTFELLIFFYFKHIQALVIFKFI